MILLIKVGYDLLSVTFSYPYSRANAGVGAPRNEILCHVEMQENKFAVQPR